MVEVLIRFFLVVVLLTMTIQDMKYRGITWYLFPLLAILLWISNSNFVFRSFMMNVSFLAVVYVFISAWLSIKKQIVVNITEYYLGLGDILFLLCLTFYFPPFSFFLFYGISVLLVSILYGVYYLSFKPEDRTIPLAGIQGSILLCVFLISWYLRIDLSDDNLMERYFELVTVLNPTT